MNQNMTFHYLPHTADIRVVITGPELSEVFTDATRLLRELFVGESPVRPDRTQTIEIAGNEPAELLLQFLREGLYLFAVDAFIPASLDIARVSESFLEGMLSGEVFDPTRHEAQPEVKAVTRHHLSLSRGPTGWRGEVIFDL